MIAMGIMMRRTGDMLRAVFGFGIIGYLGFGTLFHPKRVYREAKARGEGVKELILYYGMALFILLTLLNIVALILSEVLSGDFWYDLSTAIFWTFLIYTGLFVLYLTFAFAIHESNPY